jgi:AraC family transcriptional regulator of adaptative response/methylated-DNA-[protein]-cysteine methyltransferase
METAVVTTERPSRQAREVALAHRYAGIVADACRAMTRAARVPSLAALAARSGLSPHHFHRVFRAVTGLTPRAYADAQRAARARDALSSSGSVTDAIYEAGFGSSGHFYAKAGETLGMTPRDFRARGRDLDIEYGIAPCSLGFVLVARTDRGICAVMLGDAPEPLVASLGRRFSEATLTAADSGFHETLAAVVGLIESPGRTFDLPLDLHGTIFQRRVWQALRDITPSPHREGTAPAPQVKGPVTLPGLLPAGRRRVDYNGAFLRR